MTFMHEHLRLDLSKEKGDADCLLDDFSSIRDELKFTGLEPLVEQIRKDEEEARALLSGVAPLGPLDAKVAF